MSPIPVPFGLLHCKLACFMAFYLYFYDSAFSILLSLVYTLTWAFQPGILCCIIPSLSPIIFVGLPFLDLLLSF